MITEPTDVDFGSKMPDDMRDIFDELMAEFDAIQHTHEPCDGCIRRDKAYEHLAERFAVLTSHTTEKEHQITNAILILGGYNPETVAGHFRDIAERTIAETWDALDAAAGETLMEPE